MNNDIHVLYKATLVLYTPSRLFTLDWWALGLKLNSCSAWCLLTSHHFGAKYIITIIQVGTYLQLSALSPRARMVESPTWCRRTPPVERPESTPPATIWSSPRHLACWVHRLELKQSHNDSSAWCYCTPYFHFLARPWTIVQGSAYSYRLHWLKCYLTWHTTGIYTYCSGEFNSTHHIPSSSQTYLYLTHAW